MAGFKQTSALPAHALTNVKYLEFSSKQWKTASQDWFKASMKNHLEVLNCSSKASSFLHSHLQTKMTSSSNEIHRATSRTVPCTLWLWIICTREDCGKCWANFSPPPVKLNKSNSDQNYRMILYMEQKAATNFSMKKKGTRDKVFMKTDQNQKTSEQVHCQIFSLRESYLLTWRDRWVYKTKQQFCYRRFYICSTTLANLHYSKKKMYYFRHTYTHNIFALNPPLEHSASKSNDVRNTKAGHFQYSE